MEKFFQCRKSAVHRGWRNKASIISIPALLPRPREFEVLDHSRGNLIQPASAKESQQRVAIRSIKPANVLIDEDKCGNFSVWLLDFEGATSVGAVAPVWGSPGYVAPEVLPTGPNTRRCATMDADVYALGVVLAQIALWSQRPSTAVRRVHESRNPLAGVAKACLARVPTARPCMRTLLDTLERGFDHD